MLCMSLFMIVRIVIDVVFLSGGLGTKDLLVLNGEICLSYLFDRLYRSISFNKTSFSVNKVLRSKSSRSISRLRCSISVLFVTGYDRCFDWIHFVYRTMGFGGTIISVIYNGFKWFIRTIIWFRTGNTKCCFS